MTRFKEVSVGDRLPQLCIPVTRTLIVAGALATRDFEDVHHDPHRAVARGAPDTYMSINNTNGLIGRYVTDWTGPDARLASLSTRLGVTNAPGDTMTLTGEVTAIERDTVTIQVRADNAKGVHASATIVLRWPEAAA